MKKIFRKPLLFTAITMLSATVSSCLEEAFPEDGSLTQDQVEQADKAALAGAMTSYFTAGGDNPWDIGYMMFMMWRDAMTTDFPINDNTWDYFNYYPSQLSMGNTYNSGLWWDRGYSHISRANTTIKISSPDPDSEDAYYRGYAYALRAMLYFDMARTFEYKHTDIEALDRSADQRGIWGLTVPIITEETTEADSRHNPRAPFYQMYRFINSDLLQAQTYLKNFHSVASKDTPSLGVAYGLAARFWLEAVIPRIWPHRLSMRPTRRCRIIRHSASPQRQNVSAMQRIMLVRLSTRATPRPHAHNGMTNLPASTHRSTHGCGQSSSLRRTGWPRAAHGRAGFHITVRKQPMA